MAHSVTTDALTPEIYAARISEKSLYWTDSVFNSLSEDDRIAQLFMPVVAPSDSAYGMKNMLQFVTHNHVGGLLISKGNAAEYAAMVNEAQKLSKVPLLIAIDGEWGVSMRVSDAIRFPRNLTLGAISDDKLLFEYGQEVARQCKLLGVNIDFAPVIDVNSNPDNPVIGDRAYGENPLNVAAKGVAFAKGLESMGILSVAKHFPGHGSTSEDSHATLPVVDKSLAEINFVDLLPFKMYINSRLGGILTAHLNIPAWDTWQSASSLSSAIVTDLLKKELNFDGIIFTDALTMKGAVTNNNSVCVEALRAGNDILLSPANISQEIKAIKTALSEGILDSTSINTRIKKVLNYKYLLGAVDFTPIDTVNIINRINSANAENLKTKIYKAAVTIVKDPLHLIGNLSDKSHVIYITSESQLHDKTVIDRLSTDSPIVVVAMINPYSLAKIAPILCKNNVSLIVTYNNNLQARKAAIDVIDGKLGASGTLPVTITGLAKAGTGIKLNKR